MNDVGRHVCAIVVIRLVDLAVGSVDVLRSSLVVIVSIVTPVVMVVVGCLPFLQTPL